MSTRALLGVALAALVSTGSVAQAAPRNLSLHEAVDLALHRNLEIELSAEQEKQAHDDVLSSRSSLLPKLKAEYAGQVWGSAYYVPFNLGGMTLNLLARQQLTDSLTLSAAMPLTGLLPLLDAMHVNQHLEEAAKLDGLTVRAELVYRTTETYLRLLEAGDVRRIADEQVKDLEEQLKNTRSLVAAGTLIEADALQTQVALAQARQDLLRADAQLATLRAVLSSILGLPVDTDLVPERIDGRQLPALPGKVDELITGLRENRSEVRATAARVDAAFAGASAAKMALLPSLSVVAQYQHLDGLAPFQPSDAGFGGVAVSWNFWDLGATWYAYQAAQARARSAEIQEAKLVRDLGVELVRRWNDAKASQSAVAVAASAVDQAREALRVRRALYASGSATTVELLDTQLTLERARVNDARSTYDALVAYAALARAAGTVAQLPPTTTRMDEGRLPVPAAPAATVPDAPGAPAPAATGKSPLID